MTRDIKGPGPQEFGIVSILFSNYDHLKLFYNSFI